MVFPTRRLAIIFIATLIMLSKATAQNDLKTGCIPAESMKAEQLFGEWAVRFTNPPAGLPATATLRLERHAEFADSLAGSVTRVLPPTIKGAPKALGHSPKAALAGDLDGGLLLLDESSDNVSISGTWNGEMVKGSCGKVFQGMWKDTSSSAASDTPDIPFMLRKLPEQAARKAKF